VHHWDARCGKTAFAIDLANSLRSEYPDGQLYIELQSSRHSEIDVTDQLSRCLELMVGFKQQTPMSLDDLRKLFRSSLNGTKSLVVVDDAATAAQIEPFMPPSGCALITTTRHLLNVGNCININLAGLEMQDAVTLLFYAAGRLLGEQSSQRIAELCGLLPLALNAAGGFLKITPDMSPDAYAELLLTARKKGT
jgi:hypothetical protein